MRMWMIDPRNLCRKHLLGEHVELHMLVGSIKKNKSLDGFLKKGLLEPQNIEARHKELVSEMKSRGYNHKSPLPEFSTDVLGYVSPAKSYFDLQQRCEECVSRW